MPINTDLSVSPYFDDFDEDKNFYKVLFKPGVSVQVRELNQLQTILQAQIEKFGNNIYKRGTIIDGVNFVYHQNYSYIKINDAQLDGVPANPEIYVTNFAVDPSTNLTAHIINSKDGFETTNPDLKTLYVRYINSGTTGTSTQFAPSATLKVYDYLDSINKVVITNGSTGFSNSDSVVFCSAIEYTSLTNIAFTVGETIAQTGNTRFAIVTGIETVKGKKVLKLRPRSGDLTNTAIATTIWQFTVGQDILGATSGASATVVKSIGNSAIATVTTSADIGKVTNIEITARGQGYYVAPFATIKSSGVASASGARNYNDLDLIARNYIAQVIVSNTANSVGQGYAFSVTEGIIYQKGYFSRVEPQTVIVSKYSNLPNQLAVGFETKENIIDSNSDQDLLDNSIGTRGQYSPGADRLKLEPTLVVVTSDEASANDEFLSIVEFSEGRAYRENKRTQFNTIMDEMANRTSEQAGNFVTDKFLVTTRSTANQSNEGKSFAVVTDPGRGYINGYRVETTANYSTNVDKGIDSRSTSNLSSTIDYGNYILITQTAGRFNCSIGDKVDLLNVARTYVANTTLVTGGAIPTTGDTALGTARVRNIVYDSGEVGTTSATYRLYLFDIKMNASKNFSLVRAVRKQTNDSIADVILTFDATSNASICKLEDKIDGSSLIVGTGTDSTKNITNLTYTYRTTEESISVANNGTASFLLVDASEYMGYGSASLTDTEKKSIVWVPTSNNIVLTSNTTSDGTASVAIASNVATMSTVSIINTYDVGDFIAFWSSASVYVIRRVTGKTATTINVDSNISFTNGVAAFSRAFPKHLPIPLDRIPGATATVSAGKTLNLFLGLTHYDIAAVTSSLTFDVEVRNATPQSKTASRDKFVKLDLSSAGTAGPWCLGIPDVFRLKNVYLGTSTAVSTTSTDVTDQFFIDHNQNGDYYDLSYLYLRNDADIILTSGTWLLVQFDAYTSTAGVYTVNSYVSSNTAQRFIDDALTLETLGTKSNSFEIPELTTSAGQYFDLINCIDFRPSAANTAAYAITSAAATVNPSSTVIFSGTNKKFPLPESGVSYNRENFLGRRDLVVVSTDNKIKVVRGTPSEGLPYPKPKLPKNTLLLNSIIVPSYPCVPEKFSLATKKILNRKLSNERLLLKRIRDKVIKSEATSQDIALNQPKAYTMRDISKLERRITDLEYTVSLSLVESDLKEKVIPSLVSPELNRFKFGFFVDDYTTKKNSDIDNIEYQADVIDSRVVPISESTLLTHGRGFRLGGWQSEYALINQDLASEVPPPPVVPTPVPETPPIVVAPPATTTPSTSPPAPAPDPDPIVVSPPPPATAPPPAPVTPVQVITSKTISAFRSYRNSTYKKSDVFTVKMGSLPGTYSVSYYFYGDADFLSITKNNVVVYSGFIKKRGVLSFSHDPSTGSEYVFNVVENSKHWEYTLSYPIDDVSYVEPVAPTTNINNVFYSGHLTSIYPGYLSASALGQNFGEVAYLTQGDTINVQIASLKPSTLHTISVVDGGIDVTSGVVLSAVNGGFTAGSGLVSDDRGNLQFNMYLNATAMQQISSLNGLGTIYSTLPEYILVTVLSTDYTSIASFYVNTKSNTTAITQAIDPSVDITGETSLDIIARASYKLNNNINLV